MVPRRGRDAHRTTGVRRRSRAKPEGWAACTPTIAPAAWAPAEEPEKGSREGAGAAWLIEGGGREPEQPGKGNPGAAAPEGGGCGRTRCPVRDPGPRPQTDGEVGNRTGSGRSRQTAKSRPESWGRGGAGACLAHPCAVLLPESSSSPGYTSSASPSRCLQGRPRKPRTELRGSSSAAGAQQPQQRGVGRGRQAGPGPRPVVGLTRATPDDEVLVEGVGLGQGAGPRGSSR